MANYCAHIPNPYYMPLDDNVSGTIDATGERFGMVFTVPKSGNISKVIFRTNTVVQCTNGVDVALETVDASGDPSGSNYGGSAPQTALAIASNTIYAATLATDATATQGDLIAAVIDFGTFDTGDDVDITIASTSVGTRPRVGYTDLYTSSWAKGSTSPPMVALEYDDGSYYKIAGVCNPAAIGFVTFQASTSPDERGLRFQVPFACNCSGMWFQGLTINTGSTASFMLYEDDDTELDSITFDPDQFSAASSGGWAHYSFATANALSADTWYRVAIKATGGTNIGLYDSVILSAAQMGGFELGTLAYLTTRADAGSWTDTTTTRPHIGIIIDSVTAGAGGGLLVHGGMTGGVNG